MAGERVPSGRGISRLKPRAVVQAGKAHATRPRLDAVDACDAIGVRRAPKFPVVRGDDEVLLPCHRFPILVDEANLDPILFVHRASRDCGAYRHALRRISCRGIRREKSEGQPAGCRFARAGVVRHLCHAVSPPRFVAAAARDSQPARTSAAMVPRASGAALGISIAPASPPHSNAWRRLATSLIRAAMRPPAVAILASLRQDRIQP